jgi:hypothetical protein
MIHLSETGYNAGRRLCGSTSGESVHAMYAPLNNPEWRATVCASCMKTWADEAYEGGDEMPLYIQEWRNADIETE